MLLMTRQKYDALRREAIIDKLLLRFANKESTFLYALLNIQLASVSSLVSELLPALVGVEWCFSRRGAIVERSNPNRTERVISHFVTRG